MRLPRITGLPWEGFFILEVSSWGNWVRRVGTESTDKPSWEASLSWVDNNLIRQDGYKTRLAAQLGAEKLLRDFLVLSKRQLFPIKV